jgi:hypothetical protein
MTRRGDKIEESLLREVIKEMMAMEMGEAEVGAYIVPGDTVLYGKWKNKRGEVIALEIDPETQRPTIIVAPAPGGGPVRIPLFSVRRGDDRDTDPEG